MKTPTKKLEEQAIEELQKRLAEMKSKFAKGTKFTNSDSSIAVKVQKAQSRFKKIQGLEGEDAGNGVFFLLLDVTASTEDVYIPLSIASGKKVVGFIYHIEGTAAGEINTTDISCRGDGITKITLGTLLYAKIPVGMTASFRISIDIKGQTGKEYKVAINQINYKLDPGDARYKKLDVEIETETVKFR